MFIQIKRKSAPIGNAKQVEIPDTDLMKERGLICDTSIEWGNWNTAPAPVRVTLTNAEIQALKRKHGTASINMKRAEMVKACIQQGYTVAQIEAILRPHGRGFGARMIADDHTTLLKTNKKL